MTATVDRRLLVNLELVRWHLTASAVALVISLLGVLLVLVAGALLGANRAVLKAERAFLSDFQKSVEVGQRWYGSRYGKE